MPNFVIHIENAFLSSSKIIVQISVICFVFISFNSLFQQNVNRFITNTSAFLNFTKFKFSCIV